VFLNTETPRAKELFSLDWEFRHGALDEKEAMDATAAGFSPVNLPHDWSIEFPFDENADTCGSGGYVTAGQGWYRKVFAVSLNARSKRIFLHFDGAYMCSDVWLNGAHLGGHVYGYTPFRFEITNHLNFGGENTVFVRVDNSRQPNSRWYTGSGITRDVWLEAVNEASIKPYGVYARTRRICAEHAVVTVDASIEFPCAEGLTLSSALLDADGVQVASTYTPITGSVAVQTLLVPSPRLWSDKEPYLYRLITQVRDGDEVLDHVETTVGIRSISFDSEDGFLLNGERVKINGFCVHHDGGCVGAAVPVKIWERRLKIMKAMGANGLRCSHNPPDPALLDLCDRLGFLVMDEAFDEWRRLKEKQHGSNTHESRGYSEWFDENYEDDLSAMLLRDRNHPSIVIWSIGNEVPDQTAQEGCLTARALKEICRRYDPSRPVTQACDQICAEPRPATQEFLNELDIVGYNYAGRWRTRSETFYDDDKRANPNWRIIGTEHSSVSGRRGCYGFNEALSEWSKPYYSAPVAIGKLLKFTLSHNYVAGDFMWTGIDYLGESHWPNHLSSAGVVDICGFPKDSYYFYKSVWNQEEPLAYVFPHWNLDEEEGSIVKVLCYTNCEQAELFLNGKSYGKKAKSFPSYGMTEIYGHYDRKVVPADTDDLFLSWDVPYIPGVLEAAGINNGVEICRHAVKTSKRPAIIEAALDAESIKADSRDIAHITVRILDEDGNFVPNADNDVCVSVEGAARLIGLANGRPDSMEPYNARHMKAFSGMLLAVAQSNGKVGEAKVKLTADGLVPAELNLKATEG
jgi:beta-galactosidase